MVPRARRQGGPAGENLVALRAIEEKELPLVFGVVRAADSQIIASGRPLRAVHAPGEEVGCDGAGSWGQLAANPQLDAVRVRQMVDGR